MDYPGPAAVRETHSGLVLLVGDRAYKLKKPVRTAYLDFSTPARRLAALRRELELNRRLTPDAYLGISRLTPPTDDGDPGATEDAEPVLVMRRMPDDRRLATLVGSGADVGADLRRLARLLPPAPPAGGRRAAGAGGWAAGDREDHRRARPRRPVRRGRAVQRPDPQGAGRPRPTGARGGRASRPASTPPPAPTPFTPSCCTGRASCSPAASRSCWTRPGPAPRCVHRPPRSPTGRRARWCSCAAGRTRSPPTGGSWTATATRPTPPRRSRRPWPVTRTRGRTRRVCRRRARSARRSIGPRSPGPGPTAAETGSKVPPGAGPHRLGRRVVGSTVVIVPITTSR
jgi:hypothetical protein